MPISAHSCRPKMVHQNEAYYNRLFGPNQARPAQAHNLPFSHADPAPVWWPPNRPFIRFLLSSQGLPAWVLFWWCTCPGFTPQLHLRASPVGTPMPPALLQPGSYKWPCIVGTCKQLPFLHATSNLGSGFSVDSPSRSPDDLEHPTALACFSFAHAAHAHPYIKASLQLPLKVIICFPHAMPTCYWHVQSLVLVAACPRQHQLLVTKLGTPQRITTPFFMGGIPGPAIKGHMKQVDKEGRGLKKVGHYFG